MQPLVKLPNYMMYISCVHVSQTMHLQQCVPSSELSPQSSFPLHTWVIFKQWEVPKHCHWFGEHVTGPGSERQESKCEYLSSNGSDRRPYISKSNIYYYCSDLLPLAIALIISVNITALFIKHNYILLNKKIDYHNPVHQNYLGSHSLHHISSWCQYMSHLSIWTHWMHHIYSVLYINM